MNDHDYSDNRPIIIKQSNNGCLMGCLLSLLLLIGVMFLPFIIPALVVGGVLTLVLGYFLMPVFAVASGIIFFLNRYNYDSYAYYYGRLGVIVFGLGSLIMWFWLV